MIATGETHSVGEFVEETFALVGLDWRKHIVTDPSYLRPTEVDMLVGDASKAKAKMGWEAKTKFKDLVKLMVETDLKIAAREARDRQETEVERAANKK